VLREGRDQAVCLCGRHRKALLQEREGQVFALAAPAAGKGDTSSNDRHPHGDITALRPSAGPAGAVTAGQAGALPESTSAVSREQLAL